MIATLTTPEVAMVLGLKSRWHVEQAIKRGDLKKVPHLGEKTVRITPAEVERVYGVTLSDEMVAAILARRAAA